MVVRGGDGLINKKKTAARSTRLRLAQGTRLDDVSHRRSWRPPMACHERAERVEWLGDLDSNQDKQIQNLLSYH